ncbi:alanine racemase, N-terminal domain protein [Candidatus Endolissoclinum faulkneri L2]|uniref:Pyridoxal phosphate homeostasis protein n=1 Tax=Candidatus Endolissoclinum faulkneri L2 TaxID=1193729 RepID=K7YM57_9PROT|nr:YggS family pyridoxal phosphate-dependent enzyme [Candidatus Endolissoclinum faulkneri]AFX98587.1 alanine racemase, N-terminal domain protein [Candidatus Endolissoclinum faulkneri L2]
MILSKENANVNTLMISEISNNINYIRKAINRSAAESELDPAAVTLIAVSKGQPIEKIEAALIAGQRVFAENRIQEAESKWLNYRTCYDNIELHLICPLQTNKVSKAVKIFDVIQTIDRPKLAWKIAKETEKQNRRLTCYIQVNTGEENHKAGVTPSSADAFIARCRDGFGLNIAGLMCIPPVNDNSILHFAMLREIAKRNNIANLSMGMSNDFEKAVKMGATHVRIGTAIFNKSK